MKSRGSSALSSARSSHRRFLRAGGGTLVENKWLAGVPIVDTVRDQSLVSSPASTALPYSAEWAAEKVPTKRPSKDIDPEKLLQFSQQLYAHALALQEVIRNEGKIAYEVLRPRCDRQAAKQFEIFYRTVDEPTTKLDLKPAALADRTT